MSCDGGLNAEQMRDNASSAPCPFYEGERSEVIDFSDCERASEWEHCGESIARQRTAVATALRAVFASHPDRPQAGGYIEPDSLPCEGRGEEAPAKTRRH